MSLVILFNIFPPLVKSFRMIICIIDYFMNVFIIVDFSLYYKVISKETPEKESVLSLHKLTVIQFRIKTIFL